LAHDRPLSASTAQQACEALALETLAIYAFLQAHQNFSYFCFLLLDLSSVKDS
jgi:hypothetical protein